MKTIKKLSEKNTKQEIIDAYQEIVSKLENSPISDSVVAAVSKINTSAHNAFRQQIEELEQDFNSVSNILTSLKNLADDQKKHLEKEQQQIKIDRERQEEEYLYQFEKTKKRQEEELKEQRQKSEEEINIKKTILKSQEEEFINLKNQVKTFDARLQKETNEAVTQNTKELRVQFDHEKALSEQLSSSTKSLLEQKITSLEQIILNQRQEIERLSQSASQAALQMTRIAERAVTKSTEQQVSQA